MTAELTKVRLKHGFTNLQDLKSHIDAGPTNARLDNGITNKALKVLSIAQWPHPRWVRVNTLRTSLKEQLQTTFANYTPLDSMQELMAKSKVLESTKYLHIDKHIPDLLAFVPNEDLTKTTAYRNGLIIIQDKASCFPAYLLGPPADGMGCIDACAAPGNKTTHIAAIAHNYETRTATTIYACEKDGKRAETLQSMITKAGADKYVVVKAGQDFLELDPMDPMWNNVGSILLDPSCSGSGIIGRDDEFTVTLPKAEDPTRNRTSKKRKRKAPLTAGAENSRNEGRSIAVEETPKDSSIRLESLSYFQLKLLLHAFRFLRVTRITYSTCSVHDEENEHVVMKALLSSIAIDRGWTILPREQQVSGMAAWNIRGHESACEEIMMSHGGPQATVIVKEVAAACIRCEKGTKEGTQGFFVAGFVRLNSVRSSICDGAVSAQQDHMVDEQSGLDEDEWEGFSDAEG